jgi:hypothetical protein
VHDWCSKFNVAHALTANLGTCDFNATTLTDDSLKANTLVLTAVALPVASRSEDLFAEEAVLLGTKCAVVDCLWLLDLALGPKADLIRSGKADAELVEHIHVEHWSVVSLGSFGSVRACGTAVTVIIISATFWAADVNTKFFGGAVDLIVELVHFNFLAGIVENFDVEAERLHFLHENLEGLRNAWLWDVVTLDDCFVHLDATKHVVGLDSEKFLQAVRGTICLECPHFHFTKALSTELRLTTKWLLGDHAVWTS